MHELRKGKDMDWGGCGLLERPEKNPAKITTNFSKGTLLSDLYSKSVPTKTTHALTLCFPTGFK